MSTPITWRHAPRDHEHDIDDVTGLAARLDALEYKSGERDITGLIPDVVSGALHIQRVGSTVWIDFRDLVCADPTSAWHEWKGLLPTGFRPVRSWKYLPLAARTSAFTVGPARVSAGGDLLVYDVAGQKIMRGLISFPTPDPAPTTPFGSPA